MANCTVCVRVRGWVLGFAAHRRRSACPCSSPGVRSAKGFHGIIFPNYTPYFSKLIRLYFDCGKSLRELGQSAPIHTGFGLPHCCCLLQYTTDTRPILHILACDREVS